MAGSDLVELVEGIVHEETHVGDRGLDLAVAPGGPRIEENARISTLLPGFS